MKKHFSLQPIIIIGIILILTTNCKKEENISNNKILFNPQLKYGNVSDFDGNIYKTITIGSQTWMAENLRVTHYRDGSQLINYKDLQNWSLTQAGAYCWYNNDEKTNKYKYGALYNYYTVTDERKVCPDGYHVPSNEEWTTLANAVGGFFVAGGALKEQGNLHWQKPNESAENSSGFTALPGGNRWIDYASFNDINQCSYFWSTTEIDNQNSYIFKCVYVFGSSALSNINKNFGASIRCVKD